MRYYLILSLIAYSFFSNNVFASSWHAILMKEREENAPIKKLVQDMGMLVEDALPPGTPGSPRSQLKLLIAAREQEKAIFCDLRAAYDKTNENIDRLLPPGTPGSPRSKSQRLIAAREQEKAILCALRAAYDKTNENIDRLLPPDTPGSPRSKSQRLIESREQEEARLSSLRAACGMANEQIEEAKALVARALSTSTGMLTEDIEELIRKHDHLKAENDILNASLETARKELAVKAALLEKVSAKGTKTVTGIEVPQTLPSDLTDSNEERKMSKSLTESNSHELASTSRGTYRYLIPGVLGGIIVIALGVPVVKNWILSSKLMYKSA